MTIIRTSGLGIVCVAIAAACSAEGTSDGESANDIEAPDLVPSEETEQGAVSTDTNDEYVVARVDIDHGHSVTFYEAGPGGLFLREEMRPDQQSVLHQREEVDAIEVFRQLRPEAEIPAELSEAHARAQELAAVAGEGDARQLVADVGGGEPETAVTRAASYEKDQVDGIGTVAQAHSTSSASHFVATHGGCDWAPRLSFCRVNWSNGFWAAANPANSATCIVDHYAGNGITVQLTAGGTSLSFYQGPATIVTHSWGIVGGNIHRRIDILNASGDAFHVGCRWW